MDRIVVLALLAACSIVALYSHRQQEETAANLAKTTELYRKMVDRESVIETYSGGLRHVFRVRGVTDATLVSWEAYYP